MGIFTKFKETKERRITKEYELDVEKKKESKRRLQEMAEFANQFEEAIQDAKRTNEKCEEFKKNMRESTEHRRKNLEEINSMLEEMRRI